MNRAEKEKSSNIQDYVFHFTGRRDQDISSFEKTVKFLANYVETHFESEMRCIIERGKDFIRCKPVALTGTEDRNSQLLYEKEVEAYVKENRMYQRDKVKLFSLILEQCSSFMKTVLEENFDNHEKIMEEYNPIGLLQNIRAAVYGTHSRRIMEADNVTNNSSKQHIRQSKENDYSSEETIVDKSENRSKHSSVEKRDNDVELKAIKCFNCKGKGHQQSACPSPILRDCKIAIQLLTLCSQCGGYGHNKSVCVSKFTNNDQQHSNNHKDHTTWRNHLTPVQIEQIEDTEMVDNDTKCFNCGGFGHHAAKCASQLDVLSTERKDKCFVCSGIGHQRHDCTSLKRYKRSKKLVSTTIDKIQDHRLRRILQRKCFKCKGKGHYAKDCPSTRNHNGIHNIDDFCTNCGGKGHSFDCCVSPKLEGLNMDDLQKARETQEEEETDEGSVHFSEEATTNLSQDITEWVEEDTQQRNPQYNGNKATNKAIQHHQQSTVVQKSFTIEVSTNASKGEMLEAFIQQVLGINPRALEIHGIDITNDCSDFLTDETTGVQQEDDTIPSNWDCDSYGYQQDGINTKEKDENIDDSEIINDVFVPFWIRKDVETKMN